MPAKLRKFKPHLVLMSSFPTPHDPAPRHRILSAWHGVAAVLLLGATAMAMGSLLPEAALLFGACSAGMVVAWLLRRPEQAPPVGLVPVTFGALALWTLLQCVPMPMALLRLISPESATIWSQAHLAASLPAPGWAALSLAPGQTLIEATKWGAYAGLSLLSAWWVRHRGLSHLCWALLALSVLMGAVTVLHGILDAEKIFGFYRPMSTYPRWTRGPLLNVNHLSAYLSLGFYGAIALLLRDRRPSPRELALLLSGAVALVAGVVALASRAAVVALSLGGLSLPLLLLEGAQGKRFVQRKQIQHRLVMTLLGIFGVGTALALYGFEDGVFAGLGEKNYTKLLVARDSLPMIGDFWLTGVGRGAFEGVFFRYKGPGDYEAWGRPENILVQWASEWGLPVSLLAAGALLLALRSSKGWQASRSARVLALGLLMLFLHNLLDFNLEVPALGSLAAVLLGALSGLPGTTGDEHHKPSTTLQRQFAFSLAAGTFLAAALGWARSPDLPLRERARAHELLKQARQSTDATSLDPFLTWVKRYPADPYFPLAAGMIQGIKQPAKALRWLGWARKRGPNLGVVHLGLAEVMAKAGHRRQGLLEVRLAMERDPTAMPKAVQLTKVLAQSTEEVFHSAPQGAQREAFLQQVALQLPKESDFREALQRSILEQNPCAGPLQESTLVPLLVAMDRAQAPCTTEQEREGCKERVEAELGRMQKCPKLAQLTERLQVDLLWATGDKKLALQRMEERCGVIEDLTPCLWRVAERASTLQDQERLKRTLRVVVSRVCQDATACAQGWASAARLHEQAGDTPSALVAITRGIEHDPNDTELRYRQALIALKMGATDRAELHLRQLLSRHPNHRAAQAKLDELKALPSRPTTNESEQKNVRNRRNLQTGRHGQAPRAGGHGACAAPPGAGCFRGVAGRRRGAGAHAAEHRRSVRARRTADAGWGGAAMDHLQRRGLQPPGAAGAAGGAGGCAAVDLGHGGTAGAPWAVRG